MRKRVLVAILLMAFAFGVFYLGSIFGIYSHSKLQESTYPFHLREALVKNMPVCSDYERISSTMGGVEFKKLKMNHGEQLVMIVSVDKSGGDPRLLVSILNAKHEQYFEEVYLDCSL